MNSKTLKIKPVFFGEHPVVDFSQCEPSNFDVSAIGLDFPSTFIVSGNFSLEAYSQALLSKVNFINKNDITNFLEYQCRTLKSPSEWLDQFETLIELNNDYFSEECLKTKVRKLYMNIQICRESVKHRRKPLKSQLIDWENITPMGALCKFDFNVVKFDLSKLDSYHAKKAYLIEIKADFLQAENICSIPANKTFGTLIDIELDKLEKLQEIPDEAKTGKFASNKKSGKMRINGNANILIDIFHRLHYEFKTNGKPFIDNTPTEIANMIVDNFENQGGKKLSLSTVQSTLSPGKIEKRPTCDKRFCMRHLDM